MSGSVSVPVSSSATTTTSAISQPPVAGLFTSMSQQYPALNLAALAAAHNKNSSIADLRLKARKHAEALGIKEMSNT